MKHLQADLNSLFKNSMPKLPKVDFPSGPAYVKPLKLSVQTQLYYTRVPFSSNIMLGLKPLGKTFISFHRPKTSKPGHRALFAYYTRLTPYYYHTKDEAYLDMFLETKPFRVEFSEEFERILHKYPEYFI